MDDLINTDFTSTVHRTEYPAISPTRPELNQAGKTVLVTGGATGIGKSIAQHFVLASAATVIIVGRRLDRLNDATAELKTEAKAAGSPSKIIARQCDVSKSSDIVALWNELANKNLTVDVLVLNAAKFTEPAPLLELGVDEVWSQFETNVKGPLVLTEHFLRQKTGGKKYIVNVTSAVIHATHHPMVIPRAAYALSKTAAALAMQMFAYQIPQEELQVVTFHPGTVYADGWAKMGVTKDMLPFDEADLPGAFAVWAASKEAVFLNGRIVWASWDVDELAKGDVRKRLEKDPDYLKVSVVGFSTSKRAQM